MIYSSEIQGHIDMMDGTFPRDAYWEHDTFIPELWHLADGRDGDSPMDALRNPLFVAELWPLIQSFVAEWLNVFYDG